MQIHKIQMSQVHKISGIKSKFYAQLLDFPQYFHKNVSKCCRDRWSNQSVVPFVVVWAQGQIQWEEDDIRASNGWFGITIDSMLLSSELLKT